MSFGDKRLDRALDDWLTQTPEDYFREKETEPTADELLAQGLCPYCKEKLSEVLVKHLKICSIFKKELEGEQ